MPNGVHIYRPDWKEGQLVIRQRLLALKQRHPHGHPGDGEEIRRLEAKLEKEPDENSATQ